MLQNLSFPGIFEGDSLTHTIHVWHIYLHEWLFFMVTVSKSTSPMVTGYVFGGDPPGRELVAQVNHPQYTQARWRYYMVT